MTERQQLKSEYKELYVDLRRDGRVFEYPATHSTSFQSTKEKEARGQQRVHEMIDLKLKSIYAEGWILDGPFDAAVRLDSRHATDWLGFSGGTWQVKGAWVRLRRLS